MPVTPQTLANHEGRSHTTSAPSTAIATDNVSQRTASVSRRLITVNQQHLPAGCVARIIGDAKSIGNRDRKKFTKSYTDYRQTMRNAAKSMNNVGSITVTIGEKHTIATIKVAKNHYYALKISNISNKKDVKTKIKEAFYPIIAAHALIKNDCHQGKLGGMSFHFVLDNNKLQIEPQDPNKTKEFKEMFKNFYGLVPQFTFNDSKPEVEPSGFIKLFWGRRNCGRIDVKKATRCNASFDKILRDFSKLNRRAWKEAATFFIHPKHKFASENKLKLSDAVDRALKQGSAKFTQPERSAITTPPQPNLTPPATDTGSGSREPDLRHAASDSDADSDSDANSD